MVTMSAAPSRTGSAAASAWTRRISGIAGGHRARESQHRRVALDDHDPNRPTAPPRPLGQPHRERRGATADVDDAQRSLLRDARRQATDLSQAQRVTAEPRVEAVDVAERRRQVGGADVTVEDLQRAFGAAQAHHHRRSAPSAAKPGPRATITPQSPGTGASWRSVSASTNRIVADDMLP